MATNNFDLFEEHISSNIPILLIDASGSVNEKFLDTSVFGEIKNRTLNLKEDKFRVIFWNSNIPEKPFFKGGVTVIPFVVEKQKINQTFTYVQPNIAGNCLTFPHLAFSAIPDNWIDNKDVTKIYFITDGQIGYQSASNYELMDLKNKLSDSIKKIFMKFNNVQLNIITVEPRSVDLSVKEVIETAAGCDVYKVIMENKLTNYVTKFISYTLNNRDGFIHINKNIPPAGYLPYGEKYFSVLKVPIFISYLLNEIQKTQSEDGLLQIVQYLSATLARLTKNKSENMINDIINVFGNLFNNTKIDPMFVRMILTDAVQRENEGTANVYAAYRAQLKDLFKQAEELLNKDVVNAIGLTNQFITLPFNNKIIIGNCRHIDKNISMNKKVYHHSAISINDAVIPILPFSVMEINSKMNEQCIRQWVRLIVSKLYNVGVMDDDVIYIMLGIMLQVVLSDVSDAVKNIFRKLSCIMLNKKRLSADMTELERLEAGELPMTNVGKEESFYKLLDVVRNRLNVKISQQTLWYAICIALANEKLITKHLIHCNDAILKDYPNTNVEDLLKNIKDIIQPISIFEIPYESSLEYKCLVTLDDVTNVGGYRFLPHQTINHVTCAPMYVLSEIGYTQITSISETCVCPICYTRLSSTSFEKIGPKPCSADMSNIFPLNMQKPFNSHIEININGPLIEPSANNSRSSSSISNQNTLNGEGVLILLKGVVGAGKSYYAKLLKDYIEQQGGICAWEGTDKYCKDGFPVSTAIAKVSETILKLNNADSNIKKYVIIDTCGEMNKPPIIFNVDFSKWKIVTIWPNWTDNVNHLDKYLCWSLRNVLKRTPPMNNDTHYLNPVSAGIKTCIQVHAKKARALFGNKAKNIFNQKIPNTIEEAIITLNSKADEYFVLLNEQKPIQQEIVKIYDTLGNNVIHV